MNGVFPAAITPPHKQVSHIDQDCPWLRINVYKPPALFNISTSLATRGAHICYFEASNRVLKEKRQGTEIRVRWIADEFARKGRYGRVVNKAQIEEGTSVVLAKRVFGA